MTDDGRCAQILKSGQPCGGYAVRNSIYCFTHDPQSLKKRTEARAKGGVAARESKARKSLISEVVAVAQTSLPMFPTQGGAPDLESFEGLRTFAVSQVEKLRLDVDRGERRGEELRRWMNFLLDLSKAEIAALGKGGGLNDGGAEAGTSPEPNTLAWLERIARGPAEGVGGSSPV